MHILLTNDDGIHAEGLWAIHESLSRLFDVTVVAPDTERSAVGHSITLLHPLRINQVHRNGCTGYAVSGTPADCVKIGITEILTSQPDLVISGVNPGPNVGVNLNYSGTVSAAREAALSGIAAIAVSRDVSTSHDYSLTVDFVPLLIEQIKERGLPKGTFLNINVPACPADELKGIEITRQSLCRPKDNFHKRTDPRSQTYYWQGIEVREFGDAVDSDGAAICNNRISITPVHCDMTDYEQLKDMRGWDLESIWNRHMVSAHR